MVLQLGDGRGGVRQKKGTGKIGDGLSDGVGKVCGSGVNHIEKT
jgi:hypothetical protein